MRSFVPLLLVLLSAPLAGCGDDCQTTYTPCGGDITGAWTYQADCNADMAPLPSCPDATVSFTPNISGTYTFNADKSFAIDLTTDESGTLTFPSSCLLGLGASCSDLSVDSSQDGVTLKETCTGTSTCTCTSTVSGTLTQKGTYTTTGNDVVLTAGGSMSTESYCVNGGELDLGLGVLGMMGSQYAIFAK